jgi:hypothetical protein
VERKIDLYIRCTHWSSESVARERGIAGMAEAKRVGRRHTLKPSQRAEAVRLHLEGNSHRLSPICSAAAGRSCSGRSKRLRYRCPMGRKVDLPPRNYHRIAHPRISLGYSSLAGLGASRCRQVVA